MEDGLYVEPEALRRDERRCAGSGKCFRFVAADRRPPIHPLNA